MSFVLIKIDKNTTSYGQTKEIEKLLKIPVVETLEGDEQIIDNMMHSILLVINLHQDPSWRLHLELGHKPQLPALRKRLGALRHLGREIPKKVRQQLVN